jgi:hypothetical protein
MTRVRRRAFLRVVSATALAGLTPTRRLAEAHTQDAAGLVARTHELLRAFDAQGHHRTGTAVDRASGEWLRREAARAGGQARLMPFDLDRVDVMEAYVELGGRHHRRGRRVSPSRTRWRAPGDRRSCGDRHRRRVPG